MLLVSFQHGLKRWWTSTTNKSGRQWMFERSFQEGWWNERRKWRVYTNEDLWRCQIWFSNIFYLRWRWQFIIEPWMSFAIEHLWRCQLQWPNHVFYMVFSSCHLSALISSRLLVKIHTKKIADTHPLPKLASSILSLDISVYVENVIECL
jgi:hypothetical protein